VNLASFVYVPVQVSYFVFHIENTFVFLYNWQAFLILERNERVKCSLCGENLIEILVYQLLILALAYAYIYIYIYIYETKKHKTET